MYLKFRKTLQLIYLNMYTHKDNITEIQVMTY